MIVIIAKVAMNGGSFARVMSRPLPKPHAAPTTTARTIASGNGRFLSFASQPMTIIESAKIEPTDRSMPPMTMTAVMPIAMIPRTVTWSTTLSPLRSDRKYGLRTANTAHRRTSPTSGPWAPVTMPANDRRGRSVEGSTVVGALEAMNDPSFID